MSTGAWIRQIAKNNDGIFTHTDPEKRLPPDLLEKASIRGGEYAWPISDIPRVIEAARAANLVNLGGQLQFRVPCRGTGECYWVEVDTYRSVSTSLPWSERVEESARAALADFTWLSIQFDFFEEGRKVVSRWFDDLTRWGRDPREAMCFAWYFEAPGSEPAGGLPPADLVSVKNWPSKHPLTLETLYVLSSPGELSRQDCVRA